MTKARTNASASPAVGRNMVINGAMNVAQRSASVTGIGAAAGYFTCDRWEINTDASAGRLTMSQTADGPNGISANCLKLDCTTADTSIAAGEILQIRQSFEGQNLQRIGNGVAGAKQITVSFYVKASGAFNFVVELMDNDNGFRQVSSLFAVTTDWNRIEIVFPANLDDGSSPFDDDNANSMDLNFWLHAGASYTSGTLNTTWGDLVAANRAATEFEQEDISTTLEKCKRYYRRIGNTGDASVFQMLFSGFMGTANRAYGSLMLSPSMRTQPTMGTTGTATHYAIMNENANTACSAVPVLDGQTSEQTVFIIQDTGTDLTVGQGVQVRGNSNVTAHIAFDAEL